ncbi:MAG: Wzz/FepE/Etk N-terminal domain-containing protein [Ferruginibacter sp.]
MTEETIISTSDNRVFDEFSPKKLIVLVQHSFSYILSKWLVIVLVALLFGIGGLLRSYFKKPTYVAEITFALDEGAGQSAKSNYSQLSEQLGLDNMLEAGGVFSSATNIVELMQSRLLVEKTLRETVNINGKPIVFADLFLDSLDYRDKWMKGSAYYKMDFKAVKKDTNHVLFENRIFRNIYETIISENIGVDKKGKGTTIISVSCTSESELFSKYFLEALINKVTQYYIETKTLRAKTNVEFLQKRTDSIKSAFSGALFGKAAFTDANINAVRQISTVSGEKQQTDVQILRTTYVDLVRSLESAKTTLMRETPLIQYLDIPILPLKMTRSSGMKNFIIFFMLGAFIIIFYLVVKKGISYILQN